MKQRETMNCHKCAHEDADICSERGEHLPSFKAPCRNCIRNPFRVSKSSNYVPGILAAPEMPIDCYIEEGDLTDLISKEAAFKIKDKQIWLGNRTVGWIFKLADGRKALRTTRDRRKHFMRIFKGWGMSKTVLHFLKDTNFDAIQIQVGKTEFLNSDLEDWFKHGVERKFPGFETQVFLPEKFMTLEKQRVWDLPK